MPPVLDETLALLTQVFLVTYTMLSGKEAPQEWKVCCLSCVLGPRIPEAKPFPLLQAARNSHSATTNLNEPI